MRKLSDSEPSAAAVAAGMKPLAAGESLRVMSDAELAQHLEALERAAAAETPQPGVDAPREPE
ncbi:MAG: hypothetical protein ACFCVH_12470 [Alphaproteobacteria bacterium]